MYLHVYKKVLIITTNKTVTIVAFDLHISGLIDPSILFTLSISEHFCKVCFLFPQVWMTVSGAEERRKANPDLYQTLLRGPHKTELEDVIKTGIKYLSCHMLISYSYIESRGHVVTRWPGSPEVGGSIPAATKIVMCKNLAFNIGECVSRGSDTT